MSNKTFYGLIAAMVVAGVIAIAIILMTSGQQGAPAGLQGLPPGSVPQGAQLPTGSTGQQPSGQQLITPPATTPPPIVQQDTGSQYSRQQPTGQTMSVWEALETDLPVICTGGGKKHYLNGWKYAVENIGGSYFEVKYDGTSEYIRSSASSPWVYVESSLGSDRLEEIASSTSFTCQVVNDITDALFRLPPGSDIAN